MAAMRATAVFILKAKVARVIESLNVGEEAVVWIRLAWLNSDVEYEKQWVVLCLVTGQVQENNLANWGHAVSIYTFLLGSASSRT
jgi:hypothetical protein